jgi:hypothetical protein
MSLGARATTSPRGSSLILITSPRTAYHYESRYAGIGSIPVIARRAVP